MIAVVVEVFASWRPKDYASRLANERRLAPPSGIADRIDPYSFEGCVADLSGPAASKYW